MYWADLLNQRNEYQRLGGLLEAVDQAHKVKCEEYLGRATSIRILQDRARRLYFESQRDFDIHRHEFILDEEEVAFWSPAVPELAGHAGSALSSLRAMQNMVPEILRLAAKVVGSVPNSLSDCYNDLGKYGIPAKPAKIVEDYWLRHGVKLKGYRDIDQHFFLVATAAVYRTTPPGKLVILLPDDPSVRSRKQVTHLLRQDAFDFIEEQYRELQSCVADALRELGVEPKKLSQMLSFRPSLQFTEGAEGTRAVAFWGSGGSFTVGGVKGMAIGQNRTRNAVLKPFK